MAYRRMSGYLYPRNLVQRTASFELQCMVRILAACSCSGHVDTPEDLERAEGDGSWEASREATQTSQIWSMLISHSDRKPDIIICCHGFFNSQKARTKLPLKFLKKIKKKVQQNCILFFHLCTSSCSNLGVKK